MATYIVKVFFGNGHCIRFHVKNPKSIEIVDLRSTTCYGLLKIVKGTRSSHVSVYRNWDLSDQTEAGYLNSYDYGIDTDPRGWGHIYQIELYHDYDPAKSDEYVERLVIDKFDSSGRTRICDLSEFNMPKNPYTVSDNYSEVAKGYHAWRASKGYSRPIDITDTEEYEAIMDGFSTEQGVRYVIQKKDNKYGGRYRDWLCHFYQPQ